MRESKQPHKSVASRLHLSNADDVPIVGLGERVYESTKLAALFDLLIGQGYTAGEILKNVNLRADEVHSPKARISLKQLMITCRNASRLSRDPHPAVPRRLIDPHLDIRYVWVRHPVLP
jgi:hypothetical protein